jgi:CRP-like cAMP-binding protein
MRPQPAELAQVPIFAALSTEELEAISRWFELRTASEDAVLVGERAAGYCFFVLQSGAAVVTRAGKELRRLGPGDFFGELAILGDGRRSASVIATEPVTLYVMFGTEFRRLEAEHPAVAGHVRNALANRIELTT